MLMTECSSFIGEAFSSYETSELMQVLSSLVRNDSAFLIPKGTRL